MANCKVVMWLRILDLVHSELDSVDSNKFRDHQYSLMKQSGMNGVIGNKVDMQWMWLMYGTAQSQSCTCS